MHRQIIVPDGRRLRWSHNQCRAMEATTMAHICHICPPSWRMRLDCHVGNVQACCDQVERGLIRLQTNHDFKSGIKPLLM